MIHWYVNGQMTTHEIPDSRLENWYAEGETLGLSQPETHLEEKIREYVQARDNREVHFVLYQYNPPPHVSRTYHRLVFGEVTEDWSDL